MICRQSNFINNEEDNNIDYFKGGIYYIGFASFKFCVLFSMETF